MQESKKQPHQEDEQNQSAPQKNTGEKQKIEGSETDYKIGNSPYSDFNTAEPLKEGREDQTGKE